jgi:hypothetical protein
MLFRRSNKKAKDNSVLKLNFEIQILIRSCFSLQIASNTKSTFRWTRTTHYNTDFFKYIR